MRCVGERDDCCVVRVETVCVCVCASHLYVHICVHVGPDVGVHIACVCDSRTGAGI